MSDRTLFNQAVRLLTAAKSGNEFAASWKRAAIAHHRMTQVKDAGLIKSYNEACEKYSMRTFMVLT